MPSQPAFAISKWPFSCWCTPRSNVECRMRGLWNLSGSTRSRILAHFDLWALARLTSFPKTSLTDVRFSLLRAALRGHNCAAAGWCTVRLTIERSFDRAPNRSRPKSVDTSLWHRVISSHPQSSEDDDLRHELRCSSGFGQVSHLQRSFEMGSSISPEIHFVRSTTYPDHQTGQSLQRPLMNTK